MSRTVGGRRHADRHAAAPQVPSEPDRRFDWRDAVLPAAGILAVADLSRRGAGITSATHAGIAPGNAWPGECLPGLGRAGVRFLLDWQLAFARRLWRFCAH